MKATCHMIDVRIGLSADDVFTELDSICGTLDEAQAVAERYLSAKRIRGVSLTWGRGADDDNGPVYYANVFTTPGPRGTITFRIRR